MSNETIKTCRTCGAQHDAASFEMLPPPPSKLYPSGLKTYVDNEMLITETYRNCPCGSTLMTLTEVPNVR